MTEFDVTSTPIEGVHVLTRYRRGDHRGFLERLFDLQDLRAFFAGRQVEQVNRTYTEKMGTVRGLHLQMPPHAEMKLVSCLRGSVFDVAVDLRRDSETFGRWFGCELSDAGGQALLIPEGCAHGVQTLEAGCEMLYVHTAPYSAPSEGGMDPRNLELAIKWPVAISSISERDSSARAELADFQGVVW